jgi:hypothetical protein
VKNDGGTPGAGGTYICTWYDDLWFCFACARSTRSPRYYFHLGFVFVLIDTVMRSPWMRRIVCRHFAKPQDFADSAAGVKFSGQVAARVVGSLFLALMVGL